MSSEILNIKGFEPKLVPINPDQVREIRRETMCGPIETVTERVEVWVARLGGSAAGTLVGPFATEEGAKAHGLPTMTEITRIRYERDGVPVPGCGTATELDENLPIAEWEMRKSLTGV